MCVAKFALIECVGLGAPARIAPPVPPCASRLLNTVMGAAFSLHEILLLQSPTVLLKIFGNHWLTRMKDENGCWTVCVCVLRTHVRCGYEGRLKVTSAACHTSRGVRTACMSSSVVRRTARSWSSGTRRSAHVHMFSLLFCNFLFCTITSLLTLDSGSTITFLLSLDTLMQIAE